MLVHTLEMEVKCTPRDRVYGIELSRLGLNLIEGFTKCFNVMIGQLSLMYRIRINYLDHRDQLI